MEEFLLSYYTVLTHGVEILAALTGIFVFKKYKFSAVKYFILFLVYIAVFELINRYIRFTHTGELLDFLQGTVFEKNYWLATLFWSVGGIVFYGFYYTKILSTRILVQIVKFSTYVFLVFSIVYIIFHWNQYFTQFFPIIGVLGGVIIFLCSIFYFYETLQSDKILHFYKSINFYISFVIFIWWLITTPLVFFDVYFKYEIGGDYFDWNYALIKFQVYLFANIFMYSIFTFALIWCRPEND